MTDSGDTRLGRGLSALLGEDVEAFVETEKAREPRAVPIERIRPGKFQPRRHFDDDEMAALVASVREKGVLQPVLVRQLAGEDMFELVAGERRWRAAQAAQLHEIPVVIKELSDQDALEIALIENIQRESLTPVEEAEAYQRLIDEFAHTQDALSKVLGRSRSHVANTLRLLSLPNAVKEMVDDGRLTAGHARALIGVDDAVSIAELIVKKDLNVRQVEALVKRQKAGPASRPAVVKDPDTRALEDELSTLLGLKVNIHFKANGGTLTVSYKTLEQLDDVLHRLNPGGARVAAGDDVPAGDVDATPQG